MKKYKMIINGEKYEAKILAYNGSEARVNVNGVEYTVEIEDNSPAVPKSTRKSSTKPVTLPPEPAPNPKKNIVQAPGNGKIIAPIPGGIIDVKVKPGDSVQVDQTLIIIEAMKMESELNSDTAGTVKSVHVNKGDSVQEGQLLIEIGD